MVRALMVMLPAEVFESLGVVPPEGFHELVPASLSRREALRVIDGIPPRVVDYYCFCGTAEQIAGQVAEYHAPGCATSSCGTSRRSAIPTWQAGPSRRSMR